MINAQHTLNVTETNLKKFSKAAKELKKSIMNKEDIEALDFTKTGLAASQITDLLKIANELNNTDCYTVFSINDNNLHLDENLISSLAKCTNMEDLNLMNNTITSEGMEELAKAVAQMPKLQELWIENCNLKETEPYNKLFTSLACSCPNLRKLSFANNDIMVDRTMLNPLSKCSEMTDFRLYLNNITSSGLEMLSKDVAGMPKLEYFWIGDGGEVDNKKYRDILHSLGQNCKHLISLSLEGSKITLDDKMVSGLTCFEIKELYLSGNKVISLGLRAMAVMFRRTSHLELLGMANCDITDNEGCDILICSLSQHCKKLNSLSFAENQIALSSRSIKMLQNFSEMKQIDLPGDIPDESFMKLPKVVSKMEFLSLFSISDITANNEDSIRDLIKSLESSCPEIKTLNLTTNWLTLNATLLEEFMKLTCRLTTLNVGNGETYVRLEPLEERIKKRYRTVLKIGKSEICCKNVYPLSKCIHMKGFECQNSKISACALIKLSLVAEEVAITDCVINVCGLTDCVGNQTRNNSRLKQCEIVSSRITKAATETLTGRVECFSNIKDLVVDECDIKNGFAFAGFLSAVANETDIRCLSLANNNVVLNSQMLESLNNLHNLQEIVLSRIRNKKQKRPHITISKDGITALTRVAKHWKRLEEVTIANCQTLDDFLFKDTVSSICENCPSLRQLSLGKNNLTMNETMIKPLLVSKKMVTLELYENILSLDGVKMLAKVVKYMPLLEKLDICECSIGDTEECAVLTESLAEHCPNLQVLSIADNDVSINRRMLQSFKKLTNLNELDLYKNIIPLDTLRQLGDAVKCVEQIDIKDCQVPGREEEVNRVLDRLGEEYAALSGLCMNDGTIIMDISDTESDIIC